MNVFWKVICAALLLMAASWAAHEFLTYSQRTTIALVGLVIWAVTAVNALSGQRS